MVSLARRLGGGAGGKAMEPRRKSMEENRWRKIEEENRWRKIDGGEEENRWRTNRGCPEEADGKSMEPRTHPGDTAASPQTKSPRTENLRV